MPRIGERAPPGALRPALGGTPLPDGGVAPRRGASLLLPAASRRPFSWYCAGDPSPPTLVTDGRERVVAAGWSCDVSRVVGMVLPERVPVMWREAILPEGAAATCRRP
ncbi:MAG: hypothetical protein F4020_10670 [Gammaproteobacteria bacterium]|nr:hypothetical protein [Chloroflexota bacterium]MYK69932.1 hypothetical protein [Gammaproteobacteria bacterium]